MKKHRIIKTSTFWSTTSLMADVEKLINDNVSEGHEIVTVSFGINLWWMPTAYITLVK